jgi:hypothetical protein
MRACSISAVAALAVSPDSPNPQQTMTRKLTGRRRTARIAAEGASLLGIQH